jgi:hypothetical protein
LFPLFEVLIIKLQRDEVWDLVSFEGILVRHGSRKKKAQDTMIETEDEMRKRERKCNSLIFKVSYKWRVSILYRNRIQSEFVT